MRILWSLAVAQLWHQRGRWGLLAIGIALVVAVPVVSAGTASSAAAQTLRRTVGNLDLTDRTLLVSQEADSSLRKGDPAQNDRVVRAQLARLSSTPALRELLFRPITTQGSSFLLGGVDRLGTAVRVVSGRLPRTCTPTRCEVVVVGGGDSSALRSALRSLGAVVVGTAARTNPLLVSGALAPTTPLVLGSSAEEMAALSSLALFGRHTVWVSSVDADRVVALGAEAYVRRSADVDAVLGAQVGATTFDRPDDQLQQAQSRADTSARRFGLLGGFAAVLLLGFAVVAAVGVRRETRLLSGVLARRGATRVQVVATTVLETLAATLAGLVAGAVLGSAVAAASSDGTGHGALGVAARALADAAPGAALLALVTAVLAAAVLLWPDVQARAAWRLVDLVAIACAGAALLAADRGSVSTGTPAASGDPLVIALPVLVCTAAGLVAARVWIPLARLAERALSRGSVAVRIGLTGAIRRPLRPVVTVAFTTAAVAAVVFAGAYRATLLAGDADQASYQVPLDATVSASDTVFTPFVAPAAFGPDGRVYPVQRATVGVTRLAGVTDSVPLVAVDRSALGRMHGWGRTTGSDVGAAALAAELRGVTVTGAPTLPAGTTRVDIAAGGLDGNAAITLWLRAASGRELTIPLSQQGNRLSGTVPTQPGPLTAVALGVDESADYATHHDHAVGEGTTDQPLLSGTLDVGAVRANGAAVAWSWTSWGSLLGATTTGADHLRLSYRIDAAPVIVVPDFAAVRGATVPVAVDATTAATARGGLVQLAVDSSTTLTGRVVATLPRLPTTSGRFVLADLGAFLAARDLREPGGNATEFWVSAPPTRLAATLATPAFTGLTVTRRDAVQHDLDTDPIGLAARTLLVVVALLALAVAAVALVLLVLGERRDGAGELFAWEADGTRPRTLRRALVARLVAVAAVAVPVGVGTGLLLASVGTDLVGVDASGSSPQPPLAVTLGSAWTPAALAIGLGAGLLLGWLVAARSLRERYPVAAEADLR